MARKTSPRITPTATPRHFWLAGLGFVSIASRRTVAGVGTIADRAARARQDALSAVRQVGSQATSATTALRDRLETTAERVNAALEQAISPLVAKFKPAGKAKRPSRRGRKPAAKTARRAAPKAKVARRTRRA